MPNQKVLFNWGNGKIQVKSNRGKIYNAFCSRNVKNPSKIKIGDYVQVEFLPNAYGRKSPYITQHIAI